jgi:purine catabolism regulator
MGTVANDLGADAQDLPVAPAGVRLRDVLALPALGALEVVAGIAGLEREVRRINVMEVPDILPWVKPYELLLTTGFPLPRDGATAQPVAMADLVRSLAAAGLSGLGIKRGRYLGAVPVEVLAAAEEVGFPIFMLSPDTQFDEVIAELYAALLDRQMRASSSADDLHRALAAIVLEGGDLPQIAEEVARLLEAAVIICTPDGRVRASAGAQELTADFAGLPLHDHTGRFHTERVREGRQPAPSAVGGDLTVASIVAGGVDHGRIVAYRNSVDEPAGDIVQWLERAAMVAALAITKQLAVSAVESKFRGDYLRDVLAGTAGTAVQIVEHCAELDWDVAGELVVVVAALDPIDGDSRLHPGPPDRVFQDRFAAAWHQVVRARDRRAPVVGFSHEVVALLSGAGDADRLVADVIAAVAGDRGGGRRSFSTGVSRIVTGPAGIPAAYQQARKAVAIGRRVRGHGGVSHFDSLGVYRLLSLVDEPAELRGFADEVLGVLAGDSAEAEDLRVTLQTLLDTNLNVAETARLLHFHYNTLRYRIGKLEGILGPFTSDAHLRLNVALALQVVHMRGI